MTKEAMSPGAASVLMTGKLTEIQGEFNVDEAVPEAPQNNSNSKYMTFQEQPAPIDFLQDDRSEMTFARRIALTLMNSKWYNPKAGEQIEQEKASTDEPTADEDNLFEKVNTDPPSLEKAWAYFEHVSLDRYIVEDKPKAKKNICRRIVRKFQKGDKKLEKAEPGESDVKTALYSPIFTPHAQLGDFGLGIGLYFSTLRAITVVTVILGLISVYNIHYFASDQYLPASFRDLIKNKPTIGSAICTNTPWVPCPGCNCTSPSGSTRGSNMDELMFNRCGDIVTDSGEVLRVALKNDCDGTVRQLGAVNLITVVLLFIATAALGEYLRRQEVQFDEDEQTAQDYSVRITNPPSDATDPEEWRRFFFERCDGAQVTVCTVAVDNDFLIRTLVERRELLRRMQNALEPGLAMSNLKLAYLAAKMERERNWFGRFLALLLPGIPEFYARYVALNAKVQGLAQLDFPVTNVFLTFETEKDQRKVLRKLSVGSLKAYRNDKKALSNPRYLFRDEHVLAVEEPDEPSTIRWQDLNAGFLQKVKEQCLTVFATLCAIVAVAVIVSVANDATAIGAAFAIAAFNSVFPIFAKVLTDLEAHAAEGDKQTSLYFKIAAFRWVNTAIVITIITPFTDTLADKHGLIPQIYALFFAEILTVSAIQLADPMGHINRHILAPRATTQDAMNLKFIGAQFELAERYTDMTKILFLCVWYCSIFPGAFFLCAFALFIKYFVDRFSLMRTWKRPPQLGTSVSKFSRRYFFSLACVAMAIISSFYWSGFPFDNLCDKDESLPANYKGTFTVKALDQGIGMNGTQVTFSESDTPYRVCNQNLLSGGLGRTFPFTASQQPEGGEWMTPDQEDVTTIFGWTSVAISAVVIIKFVWGWVEQAQSLFTSSYSAVGDDQNIPFSQVTSRSAYIPQVYSPMFPYPLIACDSDAVDEELYDWADPDRPFAFYDLTKDAMKLLKGMVLSHNVGFTKVKYWAPKSD